MRSAYLVLGVPGNASIDDIERAFEKARQFYSPQQLADVEGMVDRFNEVKTAYAVLRNPDSRAAHDRKLAAAPRQVLASRIVVEPDEGSPMKKYFVAGLLVVGTLFGVGFYVSSKNAEARQQQAAAELAAKQLAAKEDEQRRAEEEKAEAARVQAQRKAEADDRRFSAETRNLAARVSADMNRQEAMAQQQRSQEAYAAQQQATRAAQEERTRVYEAQRRLAMDKQRIRELCWQQYRKTEC